MNTKLKGDLAEQAAILQALKHGWEVLISPVDVFIGYGSEIHIVVADKRQRKPKSANYRDAWNLILQWAARGETRVRNLSNSGEPVAVAIPSQAPMFSCESKNRGRCRDLMAGTLVRAMALKG